MIKSLTSKNILIFSILLTVVFTVNERWFGDGGSKWETIINSDGKGYFQYLNALFIDNNISNQEADGRYLLKNKNGRVVNIYSVGPALLISPFFAEGYFYHYLFSDKIEKNGFFFQLEVSLAALFYLTLALIFFRKSLLLLKVNDKAIIISLLALLFGTNLFYYATIEPSMSHVYSFFSISFFVYSVLLFNENHKSKFLIFIAISLAITILIRPSNGLIVFFIPFLSGSFQNLKLFIETIFEDKRRLLISALVLLLLISIQPIMWRFQSGNFFIWSYKNSGFYFSSPEIFDLLFSFRKGLFIYTPLVLLSLVGLLFIYKTKRFRFFSFLIAFSVLIYFTSSWWNWYYGDSFGMRPIIDFYAVLFIPMALFIEKFKKHLKFFSVIISLLIALNLIQTYQYYNLIMSKYDMNFEKYKYIFLKTSKEKYQNSLGGNNDIAPYHKQSMKTFYKEFDSNKYEIDKKHYKKKINLQGLQAQGSLYLKLNLEAYFKEKQGNSSYIFLQLMKDQKSIYNYSIKFNDTPEFKLREFDLKEFRIQIPPFHDKADYIVLSFVGKGSKVFIKEIKIEILYPE